MYMEKQDYWTFIYKYLYFKCSAFLMLDITHACTRGSQHFIRFQIFTDKFEGLKQILF